MWNDPISLLIERLLAHTKYHTKQLVLVAKGYRCVWAAPWLLASIIIAFVGNQWRRSGLLPQQVFEIISIATWHSWASICKGARHTPHTTTTLTPKPSFNPVLHAKWTGRSLNDTLYSATVFMFMMKLRKKQALKLPFESGDKRMVTMVAGMHHRWV